MATDMEVEKQTFGSFSASHNIASTTTPPHPCPCRHGAKVTPVSLEYLGDLKN